MGNDFFFHSNIKDVVKKIDETAESRMLEAVQEVRNKTVETLSGQRSGRTYKVPGTNNTYTASAPGEPPAVATAGLRDSIKWAIEIVGRQLIGMVGTDKDYGKVLEYGTSKMAARPWLRKSFDISEEKIKEIFSRLWFT